MSISIAQLAWRK